MTHTNDYDYFSYRVDQENDIGDRAASPAIAAIHYELAYRYALLCRENERAPMSPMVPMASNSPMPPMPQMSLSPRYA